jgi:hypothetical protein
LSFFLPQNAFDPVVGGAIILSQPAILYTWVVSQPNIPSLNPQKQPLDVVVSPLKRHSHETVCEIIPLNDLVQTKVRFTNTFLNFLNLQSFRAAYPWQILLRASSCDIVCIHQLIPDYIIWLIFTLIINIVDICFPISSN